ncbi:hypothetical protein G7Y89_g10047 [Cudoniella acicularis]|uniref:Uncharacterized protein n=1 Tax=Cudoniella acicularis TaxID=354080 RepID=A0A8H4RFT2_9HELO|nr:hypothetical protein G7Y89_g10047 [Cudoniella acicularis]
MVQLLPFLASLAFLHYTTASPLASSLDDRTLELANSMLAHQANPKAIHLLTNDANNSVVTLKVGTDGTLSEGSVTPTGGMGLTGMNAKGMLLSPDGLFSQGSIAISGRNLIAVNSGSNTITLFSISSSDPTKLTMVGNPVSSMGDFPMSVTISAKLGQACVANSGARAGIACFEIVTNPFLWPFALISYSKRIFQPPSLLPKKHSANPSKSSTGLAPLDIALRSFPLKQTTPPTGPANTISEVLFNSDSTALLTTVKGDPATNNTGFLSSYPVVDGCVSEEGETRSNPKGTTLLFGTALIPGSSSLLVTDPSFGAALISSSASAKAMFSTAVATKITGQKATCWAAYVENTGTVFVTDGGLNRLVELDSSTGAVVKVLDSTNGNGGMTDIFAKGNLVFALGFGKAGARVVVFDVSAGKGAAKEIQNFMLKGVGTTAQGIVAC